MSTLADVNKTLQDQNGNLEDQSKSLDRINKNFETFFRELAAAEQTDAETATEAERRKPQQSQTQSNESNRSAGIGAFSGGLLGAGGLLGMGKTLGMGLLKRGVPGVIGMMLADEIGDWVTSESGSKDLGDSIQRAVGFGSLGLIFGKKFAVVGAVLGAALNKENREKLEGIGEKATVVASDLAETFNVKLPSANEILAGISGTVSKSLDGIDALLSGDYENALEALPALTASVAGLFTLFMPGKAISLALKTAAKPFTAATAAIKTATSIGVGASAAAKATAKVKAPKAGQAGQLKDGTKVTYNEKTGRYQKPDGKFVSKADVGIADDVAKKFPRMAQFLKLGKALGPLGSVLGLAQLGMILAGPGSMSSKVDDIAGVFGGIGGGVLGGIAGTALGALTGPAAVIAAPAGGIIGAIGGALGGDMIAKGLAQFLLKQPVDAFPWWTGLNGLMSGDAADMSTTDATAVSPLPTMSTAEAKAIVSSMNTTGGQLSSGRSSSSGMTIAESRANTTRAQTSGNQTAIDASTTTIDASSNQTVGFGNMGSSFNPMDDMYVSP